MPIRFRCAYCNQLMGIATRKAGSVVRCPRCAGEVIVPVEQQAQAANGQGRVNPLFEAEPFGRDFADLPRRTDSPNPLMPPPPYAHAPLSTAEDSAVQPVPEPTDGMGSCNVRRQGFFITPSLLTAVGALMLAFVGVIFLLGFFVGRATLP